MKIACETMHWIVLRSTTLAWKYVWPRTYFR